MNKDWIKRILIGLVLGMAIGDLIAFLGAYFSGSDTLFGQNMIDRFGNETNAFMVHTLLSGIYGAICFAGTCFYEIEEWSLLKATILHCLLINVSFLTVGLYLGWIPADFNAIAISCSIITGFFFIIWLIMDYRYKKEVKKLNDLLREKKDKL